MSAQVQYPEHAKLEKVKDDSQKIGEFLDWLLNTKKVKSGRFERFEDDGIGIISPVRLAIYRPRLDDDPQLVEYISGRFGIINELLAEYFNIDNGKVQAEKEQMYKELVEANKK